MYPDTLAWFYLSLVQSVAIMVIGGFALHWRGQLIKERKEKEHHNGK